LGLVLWGTGGGHIRPPAGSVCTLEPVFYTEFQRAALRSTPERITNSDKLSGQSA
jgi:hypothetical protein